MPREMGKYWDAREKMFEIERVMEWQKWIKELPILPFKSGWKIKIIPPTAGAIVRFRVFNTDESQEISVYFDAYNILGSWGCPYWEIYPAENGDVERFVKDDVEGLIDGITRALGK